MVRKVWTRDWAAVCAIVAGVVSIMFAFHPLPSALCGLFIGIAVGKQIYAEAPVAHPNAYKTLTHKEAVARKCR